MRTPPTVAPSLRHRYARLEALYRISKLPSSVLQSREVLKRVLREAVAVTKANSGSLVLLNPTTGVLEIEAAIGLPRRAQRLKLRVGQGVTGWVAETGRPVCVPDVTRDPRYIVVRRGVRSELAVPLAIEGQIMGVLNVDSNRVGAFSEADQDLLVALANQSAKTLHTAWLFEGSRKQTQRLQSLFGVARTILSPSTLQEALNHITRETAQLMGTKLCSLFLRSEDQDELVLKSCQGGSAKYLRTPPLKVSESLVGVVVRRKRTIAVRFVEETEDPHQIALARKEGLVSLLAVPLVFAGHAIGALCVYTTQPHRFADDEVQLLTALADLSAIAIERARLHEKVLGAEESLRENERLSALGLLAAEVAHEIRNPLTVMKMLFHTLHLDFRGDDPRARDSQIIAQKMEQLERITYQILTLARSSEPHFESVELHKLLDEVLLLVRHKLSRQKVRVQRQFASALPPVSVDRAQIEQACLNLILNAVGAMPHGGTLTVATRWIDGGIDLAFSDTGVGMSAKRQQMLFTPFLSGRKGGTGLGLAIVRKIVENHRGQITVRSRLGRGTTFALRLPAEN